MDEGLRIERVQIEADVRVRRILNALRVKDESLAEASKRIEELEGLLQIARDDAERTRSRVAELEVSTKNAKEHAAHIESVSRATKLECSRLKGQLADTNFDLDLATSKYNLLLESHSAKNLAHDLVEIHLKQAVEDKTDDYLDLEQALEQAADEVSYHSHGSSLTQTSQERRAATGAPVAALTEEAASESTEFT